MKLTRRTFLKDNSVAGVGLDLAFYLPEVQLAASESAVFEPTAYIRITSDNVFTLLDTPQRLANRGEPVYLLYVWNKQEDCFENR